MHFVLACFWLIWRGIQDYVNAPRVMGGGLDLHPLLVIFAILVGGEVSATLSREALRQALADWSTAGVNDVLAAALSLH